VRKEGFDKRRKKAPEEIREHSFYLLNQTCQSCKMKDRLRDEGKKKGRSKLPGPAAAGKNGRAPPQKKIESEAAANSLSPLPSYERTCMQQKRDEDVYQNAKSSSYFFLILLSHPSYVNHLRIYSCVRSQRDLP
jgi:hypothetical protein